MQSITIQFSKTYLILVRQKKDRKGKTADLDDTKAVNQEQVESSSGLMAADL